MKYASRTSIAHIHIIHMRLGLSGIRKTVGARRRGGGVAADADAVHADARWRCRGLRSGLAVDELRVRGRGGGSAGLQVAIRARTRSRVQAGRRRPPPAAAQPMKVAAHEAAPAGGQTRAQVYESVRQDERAWQATVLRSVAIRLGQARVRVVPQSRPRVLAANALSVQLGGRRRWHRARHACGAERSTSLQSVPGVRRALSRVRRRRRRKRRRGSDRRPDVGRPRGSRRRRGARIPLLSSFEMGSSPAKVTAAVKAAPYAGDFPRRVRQRRFG